MIEHLLEPGTLGTLPLKNRIIYSAMTFKLGDHKGRLTDAEVESMVYRAKQEIGPGLIYFPGLNNSLANDAVSAVNINSDETMFSLARQVRRVQAYGAKVAAEIGVLGFRPDGSAYGASNMTAPTRFVEMTKEDIARYLDKMAQMARRVKRAGFDAMVLQTLVNKKILGAFISPYTNHRQDEYGGSLENRARLLLETLQTVRAQVGEDFPIILDLKVDELMGDKGLQLAEGLALAKMVAPYVDAINPTVGCEFVPDSSYAPYFTQAGVMLPYVKALKEALPETAVIASCKLGQPALAEQAMTDDHADFVALGRPLFADPEWIVKAAAGRDGDILQCIGCMNCYTENKRSEIYPMQRACTVNPCNLREEAFYHPQKTSAPQKILVAGGGLAGMEAAAVLAQRGHAVTLCEKAQQLGGQFRVASTEEEKASYRTLLPYKEKILRASGADVRLGQAVDADLLQELTPDVVVVATGAVPNALPQSKNAPLPVYQGNEVILGAQVSGDAAVVIGGSFIGLSVALQLAKAGKQVSIVDMGEIGAKVNPRLLNYYNKALAAQHVAFYPNAQVVSLDASGVEVMRMGFPVLIPADAVVQAIGTKPNRDLLSVLEAAEIPYVCIGDCKRVGDALYAVRDGAEIGRML